MPKDLQYQLTSFCNATCYEEDLCNTASISTEIQLMVFTLNHKGNSANIRCDK